MKTKVQLLKATVRSVAACAALVLMSQASMFADVTSSGTLAVSATVDPSISMTFGSDASGLALSSGAGTNTATLAFGHIKAYGYSVANVTQAVDAAGASATNFSVSTPIDVLVMSANNPSTDYTLTAALNAADAVNFWKVGTTTITDVAGPIAAHGTYGTATPYAIKVTVPFSNVSGAIANTINFVATAN